MKEFIIGPDGSRALKKQLFLRTLPHLLIALAAGITISSVNSKNKQTDVNVLPFVIPLLALSVGSGLYRGFKRQKKLLESYTLTITSNVIGREQFNTPTVALYFNDVKEIVKNKNGSFTIRGKDATDVIHVPAQVERPTELEEELAKIMPLSSKSSAPLLEKYRTVLPLLGIALMLCVYVAMNKSVVAVSGTLLTALFVWSFLENRRSKNIDRRTKRSLWWVLLVLASVIFTTIMKLTA